MVPDPIKDLTGVQNLTSLINLKRPKTPVGILRKTSLRNSLDGEVNGDRHHESGRKRTGSTPKSVKIDESSLQHQNTGLHSEDLESLLAERLHLEGIDLTRSPYTNKVRKD